MQRNQANCIPLTLGVILSICEKRALVTSISDFKMGEYNDIERMLLTVLIAGLQKTKPVGLETHAKKKKTKTTSKQLLRDIS